MKKILNLLFVSAFVGGLIGCGDTEKSESNVISESAVIVEEEAVEEEIEVEFLEEIGYEETYYENQDFRYNGLSEKLVTPRFGTFALSDCTKDPLHQGYNISLEYRTSKVVRFYVVERKPNGAADRSTYYNVKKGDGLKLVIDQANKQFTVSKALTVPNGYSLSSHTVAGDKTKFDGKIGLNLNVGNGTFGFVGVNDARDSSKGTAPGIVVQDTANPIYIFFENNVLKIHTMPTGTVTGPQNLDFNADLKVPLWGKKLNVSH